MPNVIQVKQACMTVSQMLGVSELPCSKLHMYMWSSRVLTKNTHFIEKFIKTFYNFIFQMEASVAKPP